MEFLKNKEIKRYSRGSFNEVVFVDRLNRTMGDLFEKPSFKKVNGTWIDELANVPKYFANNIHSSTKITSKQTERKIEGK